MTREEEVKNSILYAMGHLKEEDIKISALHEISLSLAIICDLLKAGVRMNISDALAVLKNREHEWKDMVEEAIEIAIRILPYAIDVQPDHIDGRFLCHVCGSELDGEKKDSYCPHCGQALKWEKTDEQIH